MAVPTVPVFDTQAIAAQGAATANKIGYGFSVTSMILIVIAVIFAVIVYIIYKKSFNVGIEIIDNTKGGIIFRENFRGKLIQTRPGEFRFKIFNAKRLKLRYNQESINPEDLYYSVSQNGKMAPRLKMTFDSEGQLVAVRIKEMVVIRPKLDKKGLPMLDEHGKVILEKDQHLEAQVKVVDIAWYYKEYDKILDVFNAKTFMEKNGWMILLIALILVCGAFLFTAYKFNTAAVKMGDVVTSLGNVLRAIAVTQNSTLVPV